MRLWSLSPRYLDTKGLLAVWREGLLARAVLMDQTRGYRNHPQLTRFKSHPEPLSAINYFLEQVVIEARARGYQFDANKINLGENPQKIPVTSDQILFEKEHLMKKLLERDPSRISLLNEHPQLELNPLFFEVSGPIELWEKGTPIR